MTSKDNLPEHATMPMAGARLPKLFAGYDSISGEIRNTALTGQTRRGGATSTVNISVCEGVKALSDALHINQSLSIDFAGVVKIDQKLEFVKSQKATSESVSIVVYARHVTGTISVDDPELKIDLSGKTTAKFVAGYGDSYIDTIEEGGEYYGVYTFYTETREQQEKLKLALDASGAFSKVTPELKIDVDVEKVAKSTNTAWKFDQQVTGIANPQLPKREAMIAYAIDFSRLTLDAPSVIKFTTDKYENVPEFDLDFDQIRDNRDYFTGSVADEGLAAPFRRILALRNKVEWLQAIYRCYGYTGDTGLAEFSRQLETDRKALATQLLQYARNPVQKFELPKLPSLDQGTPMLRFTKGVGEYWGGGEGSPFDYGSVEQALRSQRRLVRVQLRGSARVDRVAFQYQDVRGVGPNEVHGGDGGAEQNPLTLDSNEFVRTVRVRSGLRVDNLVFVTTREAQTGVGGSGGVAHSFDAPPGTVILGFSGRNDSELVGLQVVWAKLEAAEFIK